MTPTVEQLRAAGVGEACIARYMRRADSPPPQLGTVRSTPHEGLPRVVSMAGTGEGRGTGWPLVFRLTGRVVSAKNTQRPVVRQGRVFGVRKSKAAERWLHAATSCLGAQAARDQVAIEAPVRVALVLWGPLHQRMAVDGDNALGGVLDALVHAGILADDRPRIVRASSVEWRPAPAWSAEIRITRYEGPAA